MEVTKAGKGLTAFELKIAAAGAMLCCLLAASGLAGDGVIKAALSCVGSLAFPLYAFFVVEGLLRTENLKYYLLRMGAMAVLCEMPYDIFFNYESLAKSLMGFWEWTNQNPLLTLFAGLLSIWAFREACEQWPNSLLQLLGVIPGIVAAIVADIVSFRGGMIGVLLIFAIYLWKGEKRGNSYGITLAVCFGLLWFLNGGLTQACGALAFLLMLRYNGEKGRKTNKYWFYALFPLMLFGLAALRFLILGVGDFDLF